MRNIVIFLVIFILSSCVDDKRTMQAFKEIHRIDSLYQQAIKQADCTMVLLKQQIHTTDSIGWELKQYRYWNAIEHGITEHDYCKKYPGHNCSPCCPKCHFEE